MEPVHGPHRVEPCRRISIQGHRASLCLPRLVFGVPAENGCPSSNKLSLCHARQAFRSRQAGAQLRSR